MTDEQRQKFEHFTPFVNRRWDQVNRLANDDRPRYGLNAGCNWVLPTETE